MTKTSNKDSKHRSAGEPSSTQRSFKKLKIKRRVNWGKILKYKLKNNSNVTIESPLDYNRTVSEYLFSWITHIYSPCTKAIPFPSFNEISLLEKQTHTHNTKQDKQVMSWFFEFNQLDQSNHGL